jgi:F0F1-type ATP synthase delta subunit
MQETLKVMVPVILAHLLILVAVVLVIKRLLLGDTMRAVNRIREVEEEVRRKEEAIRREIAEHEKDFAAKKAQADEDFRKAREESEKELTRIREQIVEEAKKEADQIIGQAKRNEEKFRQQIAQQMEEKAVEYGGEVFKLVMSQEVGEGLNKQFTNELLDALEQVDAANITVDSANAEFTSSHPMDPAQKRRLESLLAEKFGLQVKVQEKVQEDLLAGLAFKMGSLEIDGTLRNRFHEAVTELKKVGKI